LVRDGDSPRCYPLKDPRTRRCPLTGGFAHLKLTRAGRSLLASDGTRIRKELPKQQRYEHDQPDCDGEDINYSHAH
jgi:hypothetical protein